MEKIKNLSEKLLPLVLTAFIVVADQITKIIIVKTIPPFTIGKSFFGDLLRIVHVSNLGAAFSMGDNLPDVLRRLLLAVMPLIVIGIVVVVYFRNDDFTKLQRWMVCGIVGGGFGNLIDRFFRAEGVVDFIDVKFFGLFGLERWPTFNIADSAVVVCGLVLVISFLFTVNKNEVVGKEKTHVGK